MEDKLHRFNKKSNHKSSFSGKKENSFKRKDKNDSFIFNIKAQNVEALEELLKNPEEHNVKINYKHENDYTALHMAAALGNEKMVQLLVDSNADINALTEKQETPLILAAKK